MKLCRDNQRSQFEKSHIDTSECAIRLPLSDMLRGF
jgi:hypothetical protein